MKRKKNEIPRTKKKLQIDKKWNNLIAWQPKSGYKDFLLENIARGRGHFNVNCNF